MLAMLAPIASFVMLSIACRSSLESLVSHRERPQLARLERRRGQRTGHSAVWQLCHGHWTFFYMALVGESHSNTWTTASLVALWNLHMNIVKLCACTITQVVHFSN